MQKERSVASGRIFNADETTLNRKHRELGWKHRELGWKRNWVLDTASGKVETSNSGRKKQQFSGDVAAAEPGIKQRASSDELSARTRYSVLLVVVGPRKLRRCSWKCGTLQVWYCSRGWAAGTRGFCLNWENILSKVMCGTWRRFGKQWKFRQFRTRLSSLWWQFVLFKIYVSRRGNSLFLKDYNISKYYLSYSRVTPKSFL